MQVTLCEQVQGYLSKYMDNKADGDAAAEKAEVKPLDGMAIYTKKRVGFQPVLLPAPFSPLRPLTYHTLRRDTLLTCRHFSESHDHWNGRD